jgi:CheY-like chemotaxis protein
MQTTTIQETRTGVEQRTAHVLADPSVWPSAFQKALEEKGFTVLTSQELHELFDRSHDGSPDLLILAKQEARFAIRACRAVRGLRDLPTIVVIPSESDFVPVMDAGADDAVTAPATPMSSRPASALSSAGVSTGRADRPAASSPFGTSSSTLTSARRSCAAVLYP